MEAAIFGFVGALIGTVLVFIGSILSTFGKSKDVQLDVPTKVVTNERAEWRKDMRELSATYVALSNRVAISQQDNDKDELERTRVLIQLRLNANPDHKLDAKLLLVLPAISKNAHAKNINDLIEPLC